MSAYLGKCDRCGESVHDEEPHVWMGGDLICGSCEEDDAPPNPAKPMTTTEWLCDEYRRWCDKELLPQMSADELLCENGLNDYQVAWLKKFVELWDEAENRRD